MGGHPTRKVYMSKTKVLLLYTYTLFVVGPPTEKSLEKDPLYISFGSVMKTFKTVKLIF